jgi:hypothetical protein
MRLRHNSFHPRRQNFMIPFNSGRLASRMVVKPFIPNDVGYESGVITEVAKDIPVVGGIAQSKHNDR